MEEDLNGTTLEEIRRFLREWADRMQAVYRRYPCLLLCIS